MRNVSTILAALVGIVVSLCLNAQNAMDLDAQWRAKMHPDQPNAYSYPSLQEALKISERFGDGDPRLFETLVRLAVVCQEDEFDECGDHWIAYANRALGMRSKVKRKDAHFADLLMDLGSATEPKQAVLVYRDALDIRERIFGTEAQSVAETYVAMARASQQLRDPVQARRLMQYALDLRARVHQKRTAEFADLLEDSAQLYGDAKDPVRAQAEYERAIALRETLWGSRDPRFVDSLRRLAGQAQFGNEPALAEKLYRRLVEIQRNVHTETSEQYYSALTDLAHFLQFRKRFADSQKLFENAFSLREKMHKQHDAMAAACMESIADVRMARGMYKEAIEAGEASFQIRARLDQPAERSTISIDAFLAEAYLRDHNARKSEAYFQALHDHVGPEAQYTIIETAEKLSEIYQDRGNYPDAVTKLEVAVAAIEAQNPADSRLPQEEVKLGKLYQLAGRPNDANRVNMAAIRLSLRNIQRQGNQARIKYFLIGLVVVLFVMPIVGTAAFGALFVWSTRKMDRKLALLYRPAPEPIEATGPLVSNPTEPAFVGGFLGLSAVAVAEEAPVVALEEAVPPAPVEVSEPPASQVALHADGSDLFAMRVLNLLLSLLTLGIYSFWGKAKVRRYVCGQAEYLGDWFAFHGTGRELLLGWLRALPALAFIFLFPTLLPLFWQRPASPYVAQLSAALAFLLLWPIARVGAYRYRLNRMSWRAIRFSYRGKAPRYLGESVAGCLLSIVTLGLYVPFLQVRLRKLLLNRTYFGDHVFQFPGRGADLLPAWLFALPLTVCSFGIGWAWWRALSHRYCWAHTKFAGARFRCTATGGKLLWLWVGNALVIVPTLGLGISWAMLRTLRFWTKHIELVGEPEIASIQQDARATSATAETFADFLGFDFGF